MNRFFMTLGLPTQNPSPMDANIEHSIRTEGYAVDVSAPNWEGPVQFY